MVEKMDFFATEELVYSSGDELDYWTFVANANSVVANAAYAVTTNKRKHGGSQPGRRPNIDRGHLEGFQRIYADYFAENPVYSDEQFRRRFRMRRSLFTTIVDAVETNNNYFKQKRDATKKLGLHPIQKVTAALRQLAYGTPADACDEYLRMSESTAIESLLQFCWTVINVFSETYLRYPTKDDIEWLLKVGEKRGFRGMLGSLDCMHWPWKNCPAAWAGQYQGKEKEPTIILEAVVSYDLWFWHAYFGMPGSHNDINVLDRSPLFTNLCEGRAPEVTFQINNETYNMGYYLADGIYPEYATLVKTISSPQGEKKKHFAKMQECFRKDVECGFGVLQARFAITKGPSRFWRPEHLNAIMKTCIILHNMIVEDERDDERQGVFLQNVDSSAFSCRESSSQNPATSSFLDRFSAIRDTTQHYKLRNDLIEHLWNKKNGM